MGRMASSWRWPRWRTRSRPRRSPPAPSGSRREAADVHALDRPVWASLTSFHAPLAEGDERAKRYARDVNLFASARDDEAPAQAALAALVGPGERVYVLQVPSIAV